MPPSNPMRFLIGRVAGAVEPTAYAVRVTSEETVFVADAEPDETGHPACGPDAASGPGVEAA